MRSVYIHIPFCNNICSYCDFCKFLYNEEWAKTYLDVLEREINTYYEFTFECNVTDITPELMVILENNGVNRLSVGIESFNKNNLKYLNRKYDKDTIIEKINLAKKYFENINVDLIYALPIESMHTFKSDVKNILKLDVPHISTYSLIIEEHTKLYNDKTEPIDEDDDSEMYEYICKKLKKKGYVHYEISNFAKSGYESRHNLTYWRNEEYYGFGLGAHGYVNKMRYENTRNFNKYVNNDFRLNELLVSTQEEMENELILGLRTKQGINNYVFNKKFGMSVFDAFPSISNVMNLYKNFIKYKEVDDTHAYLYIPESKFYVMNEILNMIL